MIISLDYDDTFTRDPDFWLDFVKSTQLKGHKVVCVTARHHIQTMDADFDPRLKELIEIFPTGGKGKMQFMRNKGWEIDVWIDDQPHWIVA